jgi:hypothetical protein
MIPNFEKGVLPLGIHAATWEEVVARFGWNARRLELLSGLRLALRDLRAAGCTRVWLGGGFITAKDLPSDFDVCWDMEGVDYAALTPALVDVGPPRVLQKVFYGGDLLPNVVEDSSDQPFLDFFQQDAETGTPRGIVQLELKEKDL